MSFGLVELIQEDGGEQGDLHNTQSKMGKSAKKVTEMLKMRSSVDFRNVGAFGNMMAAKAPLQRSFSTETGSRRSSASPLYHSTGQMPKQKRMHASRLRHTSNSSEKGDERAKTLSSQTIS